ncbi:MAG TPA: histidine kinase [Pyrinomonadaceae bacterium]
MAHRRLLRLGMIWGIWTLIGLFFTSQLYLARLYTEKPLAWLNVLVVQLAGSYLWALATPLILWLARRFPFERRHWLRNLSVHLSVSVLLITLIYVIYTGIFYMEFIKNLGYPLTFRFTIQNVIFNFSEGVSIYLLLLFISHALDYYHRYQEKVLEKSQLEMQLAQAQLQALKMQLHPHFLFNTLHSISALLNSDTEAARQMIARLGDFLRLTLENSGTQEVSLQTEIEFLQSYLEIEHIRFQDRMTTHVQVEPQALDAQVPNLILQPIVENAIRHGIAPRSTPGRIEIRAEHKNSVLRIEVRDNGPGLPVNRSAVNLFKEGLGLANTRARLQQLYGAAHRFELTNDPAGGLIVTLEIPSETVIAAA